MNRIEGKIALITGGTQGLGAAIAGLFAKAGAAGIAIVGRDQAKGDAVARQITAATGVPVLMIVADLGDIADCARCLSAIFVSRCHQPFLISRRSCGRLRRGAYALSWRSCHLRELR